MDSPATDEARRCFFFKPPPEIRVQISEYALAPDTAPQLITEEGHGDDCSKSACVTRENWHTRSALLQVCRLVRQEAMPMFFQASSIHFLISKNNYGAYVRWLGCIGKESARLIPKLIISWRPTQQMLDEFSGPCDACKEAFRSGREDSALTLQIRHMVQDEVSANREVYDTFVATLLSAGVNLDAVVLQSFLRCPGHVSHIDWHFMTKVSRALGRAKRVAAKTVDDWDFV